MDPKFYSFLLILLLPFTLFSQREITGTVTDAETGDPLIGVTVLVQGTGSGTVTDIDGQFAVNADLGDTLEISYVGYATQEVAVGAENIVQVELGTGTVKLNEVVVIGYGESVKRDLTGSISRVGSEELEKRPSMQAAQALQGKASGVQIVNSGEPGEQPVIRIRGTGTVLAGANPLYVVDGVFTDDISNINPSDIKSIDILKDASSLAIYGLRGANGVIIVTTKKGRNSQQPRITFNLRNGINTATNLVEMADARTFAEYTNEFLAYAGEDPQFDPNNLQYDTDWYDAILRTGYVQSYSAALSGGSDNIDYYLSLGYDNEEGILKKNDFQRLTSRFTANYSLSERVKIGTVIGLSKNTINPAINSAFQNAYNQWPTVPVRFEDGSWGFDPESNVGNPVAQIEVSNRETVRDRLQGSFFGEVEIIEDLTFKSSINLDDINSESISFTPEFQVSPNSRNERSDLNIGQTNSLRWIWDNIATYRTIFDDKHFITAMAGITSEEYEIRSISSSAENVPNNEANWFIGAGEDQSVSDDGDRQTRFSYLGRLIYNFDDRYIFTGSLRREASSKFAQTNRSQFFPAIGVGWKITSEEFMQSQDLFDFLKLRASWGKIANDNIPSAAFIVLAEPDQPYDFSGVGNFEPGIQIRNLKDTDLGWETTTGFDIGLEAEFLGGQLFVELDYYDKLTEDVLLQTVVNRVFGDADRRILTNLGDVSNTGFEVGVEWNQILTEAISFSLGFHGTHNDNVLESLGTGVELSTGTAGISEPVIRIVEGAPIGSFWVYETDGIFQSQEEIDNSGITRWPQSNMRPGDLRFVDQNDDGIINSDDRVLKGSHQPKLYFGLNMGVSYRSLALSIDLYGNTGNKIYNGKKSLILEERNIEASRADRWRPENPSNTEPRATQDRQAPSDYYLEDGDFLRVNTINLSYEFPESFIGKIRANHFSVYLNAQNPLRFESYSGFNVEFPGAPTDNGIEQNAYPATATYSIGINLRY